MTGESTSILFHELASLHHITYQSLEGILYLTKDSKKSATHTRKIKKKVEKMNSARQHLLDVDLGNGVKISDTSKSLSQAFRQYEHIYDDGVSVEELEETIQKSFEKGEVMKETRFFTKLVKPLGYVAAANAALTCAVGDYYSMALNVGAFGASQSDNIKSIGKSEPVVENDTQKITGASVVTGLATGAHISNMLYRKFGDNDTTNLPLTLATATLGFANIIGVCLLSRRLINYGLEKRMRKKSVKRLYDANKIFPTFAKTKIAVSELHKAVTYIDNVCHSENRAAKDFLPQLNKLESAIIGYVDGSGSYDDVLASRITYTAPQAKEKKTTPSEIQNDPSDQTSGNGYTTVEYAELKKRQAEQSALENRKRKNSGATQSDDVGEIATQKNKLPAYVANVSDDLTNRLSTETELVSGLSLNSLVDYTRSKLESGLEASSGFHKGKLPPNMNLIKETASGKKLAQGMRRDYAIPKDARLYKFQPRNAFRALIYETDGKPILVDIMSHGDYDKLGGF